MISRSSQFGLILGIVGILLNNVTPVAYAAGNSVGTSSSNWAATKRMDQQESDISLNMRENGFADGGEFAEVMTFGNIATRLFTQSDLFPSKREVMSHMARSLKTQLQAKRSFAEQLLWGEALSTANRGAAGVSSGETRGGSSTYGYTGTAAATTQSMSNSWSSSTTTNVITCEEYLKWKGFQVGCQTGSGSGVVDGISYEFLNWRVIRSEGVEGPVRWRYQGEYLTVEHIAKGTEITFAVTDKDVRVISASGLMSFKRDLASADMTDDITKNTTREKTDLAWHSFATNNNVVVGGIAAKGEWLPNWNLNIMHRLVGFVELTTLNSYQQLISDLTKLKPAEQAKVLSGDSPAGLGYGYLYADNDYVPFDWKHVAKTCQQKPKSHKNSSVFENR